MDKPADRTADCSVNNVVHLDFSPGFGPSRADKPASHYRETIHNHFGARERGTTTILVSGLTISQDRFFAAAIRGAGCRVRVLDPADNASLQIGKEFGNRGQCNPTYFTSGNLVKFLIQLRDREGIPTAEIIRDYLYITSSSCGPCRFGSYITEYRKALRDAGFEGFRVLTASQTGGVRQAAGSGDGLVGTPKLYLSGLFGLVVGDVLNALMYRIRPYEVNAGETDRVIEECRCLIENALGAGRSLLWPLWQCRQKLAAIAVDRSRVKPKVSVIGEFWAMTTEGDGNYRLPAFLESEGAEVDVQLLTAWMLYLIWSARHDTKQRATLNMSDSGPSGLQGKSPTKKLATLWVAEKALLAIFGFFARLLGLRNYHFPSMDEIAEVSRDFYNSDSRGGEGHMEVGKFILNARHQKMNLTLSVKPFGCMPSSAVSDGIQSKVTALYPHALFLPVETTGDGAVNVYSRIQMQLYRARQQAKEEVTAALQQRGLTEEDFRRQLLASKANHALYYPPQTVACTAANIIHSLG